MAPTGLPEGTCRDAAARMALCLVAGTLLPGIARAELLQEIRSRGTLRVGMAEYSPWMTLAPGGKPTARGRIVERLAGDLGVQLQVVPTPFDALVDRLAVREVDMVASNLSITPERALKVAFTEPYGDSEIRAVLRTDLLARGHARAARTTKRSPSATTAGTTGAADRGRAVPDGADHRVPDPRRSRKALLDGTAKALVGSTPFPETAGRERTRRALAIAGDQPLRTTVEAFAVPQGEQIFLTFLDNWIDAVTAEGFIDATRHAWLDQQNGAEPAAAPQPSLEHRNATDATAKGILSPAPGACVAAGAAAVCRRWFRTTASTRQ